MQKVYLAGITLRMHVACAVTIQLLGRSMFADVYSDSDHIMQLPQDPLKIVINDNLILHIYTSILKGLVLMTTSSQAERQPLRF